MATAPPVLTDPPPVQAAPPAAPEPADEPDAIDALLAEPPPPLSLPPIPAPAAAAPSEPGAALPAAPQPYVPSAASPAAAEAPAALPSGPQPYVPSTPPTATPGDPTQSVELSEDEAEGDPNAALPRAPQPYLSLPGSPLFEPNPSARGPRPYVAPRSLLYELPSVAEQAYESGVRGNAMAAQVARGPLDGGWTVLGPNGDALFRLQLSDDGSAVDGAWTDPNVPPGTRSGLVLPTFRTPGSPVALRFTERPGAAPVVITLAPGLRFRAWSGQVERAGERTAITLQPF